MNWLGGLVSEAASAVFDEEPEPEPQPEPESEAEAEPESEAEAGDGAGTDWWGAAISGISTLAEQGKQAAGAAAKAAGVDELLEDYKQDFAEFASVVTDDAKTVKKEAEVVNAKVAKAAVKLKRNAEEAASKAKEKVEAKLAESEAGGQLLKLGRSTADVMAQLRSELGLSEGEAPTAIPTAMRVDRLAEHIKSLRVRR